MKSRPIRPKQKPKARPKKSPPSVKARDDSTAEIQGMAFPVPASPQEFDYRTLGPPPSMRDKKDRRARFPTPKAERREPARPAQDRRGPGSNRSNRDSGRATPIAKPSAPSSTTSPEARTRPIAPQSLHVAPLDVLAKAVIQVAKVVEKEVFDEGKRADRAIAFALRNRRDLAAPDHRFIAQAIFALFRWHGWVRSLNVLKIEERLLLSWLLDSTIVHPVCRVWGQAIGRDASRLVPMGDAPNWTVRAEALKRWSGGRGLNVDPWKLIPGWVREHLPKVPAGATPKTKYLELLDSLQRRAPLWVRAQGSDEKKTWKELREAGLKPWLHRELERAAKLEADVEIYELPPFVRGELEIQDLASQTVGLICDPDPGDRWWDACAGAGGKSLHLAALMGGKGVVVATDNSEYRLKEAVRRARKSPFRNITTKTWDGKHAAGKPESFDGVLVDAPCSGIGTWRRNPEARWTLQPDAIARLAETQLSLLTAAAAGVKTGGTLVYSVCTITPTETTGVVNEFLKARPEFKLDPFPHPIHKTPTNGTLLIWPEESDSDAMFIARMVRTSETKAKKLAPPKDNPVNT